jgi:hypothetical protein
MKLVHNLGEMDEVLDKDLNDHVDTPHEYRTLHKILRSFWVKNNQVILLVEKKIRSVRIDFFIMKT